MIEAKLDNLNAYWDLLAYKINKRAIRNRDKATKALM